MTPVTTILLVLHLLVLLLSGRDGGVRLPTINDGNDDDNDDDAPPPRLFLRAHFHHQHHRQVLPSQGDTTIRRKEGAFHTVLKKNQWDLSKEMKKKEAQQGWRLLPETFGGERSDNDNDNETRPTNKYWDIVPALTNKTVVGFMDHDWDLLQEQLPPTTTKLSVVMVLSLSILEVSEESELGMRTSLRDSLQDIYHIWRKSGNHPWSSPPPDNGNGNKKNSLGDDVGLHSDLCASTTTRTATSTTFSMKGPTVSRGARRSNRDSQGGRDMFPENQRTLLTRKLLQQAMMANGWKLLDATATRGENVADLDIRWNVIASSQSNIVVMLELDILTRMREGRCWKSPPTFLREHQHDTTNRHKRKGRKTRNSHLSQRIHTKRLESFVVAKLAEIQPYDVIVDPICRRATILIEASKYWPLARYIGMDDQIGNLEHARMNADSTLTRLELYHNKVRPGRDCTTTARLNTVTGDVLAGSVDKLMTCLPFGKTSGEYALLLLSWVSLLKPSSGASLILVVDIGSLEALELAFMQVYGGSRAKDSKEPTMCYHFKKCITSLGWGRERAAVVRIRSTLIMEEDDGYNASSPDEPVPVFCPDEWALQRIEQLPRLVPVQPALIRYERAPFETASSETRKIETIDE